MEFIHRGPLKSSLRYAGIFLLPILLGLPFIRRACFVDDNYQILMARGILEHPLRPYDFIADDAGPNKRGWERGQPPRMVNPPGHHYLAAILLKLSGERPSPEVQTLQKTPDNELPQQKNPGGANKRSAISPHQPQTVSPSAGRNPPDRTKSVDDRLWVVRLGMLVLAGLSALLLFRLAQWLLVPPIPATVISVMTPALWLSSYSLLIDPTMLVFFLGALWAWIEGLKKRSAGLQILAGVFMGLTLLTKYTGAYVILLALGWWALQPRSERRWRPLAAMLIPTAMLAAWSLWNVAIYGAPHLTESSKRAVQSFQISRTLIFFVFFSGVIGSPLLTWKNRRSLFPMALAAMLTLILASPWGGFTVLQAALISFFAVGGALFFATILPQTIRGPLNRTEDRFLVLWLLIGSVQMIFVMGWVAARYYLTLVPPAVFLTCRWIDEISHHSRSFRNRLQTSLGAALLVVGLAVAWADYSQAEVNRRIVRDTNADNWLSTGRRCFFLGDSFTASSLKYAGWEPAFPDTEFKAGDLVLVPQVVMPPWWFKPTPQRFHPIKIYEYRHSFPLRVMDSRGAAGFYASAWGALPYTISGSPLERYLLLEVLPTRGMRAKPGTEGFRL